MAAANSAAALTSFNVQRGGARAAMRQSRGAVGARTIPLAGVARRRLLALRCRAVLTDLQRPAELQRAVLERQLAEQKAFVATMGEKVVDQRLLRSTPQQRAVVGTWWALQAGVAAQVVSGAVGDGDTIAACALAAVAAYFAADLGSGVFHWATDNYGDKETPLLGSVIDAFQGHHKYPRTITQREFCNNVAGLCSVQLAPLALLMAAPVSPPAHAFGLLFLFLTAMSQQTHAWSHSLRSELPAAVRALQDWGVLVSPAAHAAHHKPPFCGNYCIVSGVWNPVLDAGAMLALERVVYGATGVSPRAWTEPEQAWQPEEEV